MHEKNVRFTPVGGEECDGNIQYESCPGTKEPCSPYHNCVREYVLEMEQSEWFENL